MELPADIQIHNSELAMKGREGTLLNISDQGFYEINCLFGEKVHRVLLPIQGTSIILAEPEQEFSASEEIER